MKMFSLNPRKPSYYGFAKIWENIALVVSTRENDATRLYSIVHIAQFFDICYSVFVHFD